MAKRNSSSKNVPAICYFAWTLMIMAQTINSEGVSSWETFERIQLVGSLRTETASTDESCLKSCSQMNDCVAYSFGDKSCRLAVKGNGGFQMSYKNGWKTSIFTGKAASQADLSVSIKRNTLLVNHYKSIKTKSVIECWQMCTANKSCSAISHEKLSSQCFLFTGNSFFATTNEGFLSYFKKELIQPTVNIHENTRLVDKNSKGVRTTYSSAKECWLAQVNKIHNSVQAVSFKDGACYVYEATGFEVRKEQTGWTTIALESINDRLLTKYVHDDLLLLNSYKSRANMTQGECWKSCTTSLECYGVSHSLNGKNDNLGKCLYYRESDSFGQRQLGWTTFTKSEFKQPLVKVNDVTCLKFDSAISASFVPSKKAGCLYEQVSTKECRAIRSYSVNECWQYCRNNLKNCSAISYDGVKCVLFKSEEYEAFRSASCVAISYESENMLAKTMDELEDTKMLISYGLLNASSVDMCIEACHLTSFCIGFSYSKSVKANEKITCHFFSINLGSAIEKQNWSTYIKTASQNELKPEKLKPVKHFENVVIGGHFEEAVQVSTEMECWVSCLEYGNKCIASSFSEITTECFLFKKQDGNQAFYQKGWATYLQTGEALTLPRIEL